MRSFLLLSVWMWSILPAFATDYARPHLLLEPNELANPEVAKAFVILDVRTEKKYKAGRIPGAIPVQHDAWVKAFNNGKDVEGWAKRLAAHGIRPDSRVVLYDDTGVKDAAQIWFILRFWGVDARILNGAWNGWKAGNYPTESGESKSAGVEVAKFTPRPHILATKEAVLQILKDKKRPLIDARSDAEYTGREKFAQRAGTIPGSVHLEWTELLEGKTQRFKSADELAKLFRDQGIDPARPATAFCQSGRRSSVTLFALELLGNDQSQNYFNSWFEWGNLEDTPIENVKR